MIKLIKTILALFGILALILISQGWKKDLSEDTTAIRPTSFSKSLQGKSLENYEGASFSMGSASMKCQQLF